MDLLLSVFFWCGFCTTTKAQNAANFIIEEVYNCENLPNQTVKLSIVPRTFEPRKQKLDITLITPIPLGNELRLGLITDMEITLNKKRIWQHLFSVEDDLCRVVQHYIGELLYKLEDIWGILRGSCPIPKGNYHAVNYTLDFSRMKLQTFPFGKLRASTEILEKRTKNRLHCSVYIITNKE